MHSLDPEMLQEFQDAVRYRARGLWCHRVLLVRWTLGELNV
jgi:hypothetical protein